MQSSAPDLHTRPLAALLACALLLSACSEDDANGGAPAAGTGAPAAAATAAPPVAGTVAGAAAAPVAGTSGVGVGTAGTAATPAAGSAGGDVPEAGATAGAGGAAGAPTAGTVPTAGTAGAAGEPTTTPSSSDWAMMGYDIASTYNNSAETRLSRESAANLAVAWTANLGGNIYGAALQVGDAVYASGPNAVYAFDAASGAERWSAPISSSSSMSYADGMLYLNDNASDIVAIDATSGSVAWTKPSNPSSTADGSSSALVVGDQILIGGSNGTIELVGGSFRGFMSALDRATGDIRWTEYTVPTGARGASLWSSPAADMALGYAFGTTGNNYGSPATDTSDAFLAFDLATGAIVWKAQRVAGDTFGGLGGGPDADFGANPVVYETMVDGVMTKLVGSGNKGGDAHAVRAEDGTLVWTRDLCGGAADGSRGIFTNAAWTGRDLMVACNEGIGATLYALDGATGDVAWMRSLSGMVWGRTAVANGVGVVGAGSTLEVFDVDTGDVIKSFPSGGGTIASTITIANGRIAFGDGLTWSSGVRGSTLTVLAVP